MSLSGARNEGGQEEQENESGSWDSASTSPGECSPCFEVLSKIDDNNSAWLSFPKISRGSNNWRRIELDRRTLLIGIISRSS